MKKYIMMKNIRHFLCFVVMLVLFIQCLSIVVRADTGPKPSIEVKILNPPDEPYYIDLLEQGFAGDRDSEDPYDHGLLASMEAEEDTEQDRKIKNILCSYYVDGWGARLDRGIVDDVFHPSNQDHRYSFGYSVPVTFKVIVVTASGKVYVSDVIERQEYNAVVTYDLGDVVPFVWQEGEISDISAVGEIKEVRILGMLCRILQVCLCYLITLLVEGICLLFFGLASARNIKYFILINTVTQVIVQWTAFHYGMNGWYPYILFFYEIFIFIIEAVYYVKRLHAKDGKPHPLRNMAYAFTANVLSYVLGVWVLFYINFVMEGIMVDAYLGQLS